MCVHGFGCWMVGNWNEQASGFWLVFAYCTIPLTVRYYLHYTILCRYSLRQSRSIQRNRGTLLARLVYNYVTATKPYVDNGVSFKLVTFSQ